MVLESAVSLVGLVDCGSATPVWPDAEDGTAAEGAPKKEDSR